MTVTQLLLGLCIVGGFVFLLAYLVLVVGDWCGRRERARQEWHVAQRMRWDEMLGRKRE